MATLTSGNSTTITLAVGQTLIISSSSDSKVLIGEAGKNSHVTRNVNAETIPYGPFTVAKSLTLTCNQGSVEYDVETVTNLAGPIIVSDAAPIDEDGRPEGTLWLRVTS